MPAFLWGGLQGLLQQASMVAMHLFLDPARSLLVARAGNLLRHVENEQAGLVAVPVGEVEQAQARFRLQGCAVGDGETPLVHAFVNNIVEQIEGVAVDALVVLVVTDEGAAIV